MCPVLFELFGLHVYSYGAMIAVAFVFAVWHIRKLAAGEGIKGEGVVDAVIVAIISALVGARIFHVLQPSEWRSYYSVHPARIFDLTEGGLVFYGGLIACFVTLPFVFRKHKMPFWPVADCFAPSIAIGHGFVRFGCFLNGCCYGKPAPWGFVFPDVDRVPRQPSQLYEAAAGIAIFGFLVWLFPKRRFHGQVILAYLVLSAVSRFLIEFTRGDADRGGLGPFATSQWVALGIVPVAGALWPWRAKTAPREPATAPS